MTSKKNRTLRAAVLMLALVLITSCFVGGTFAKYVTSGDAGDNARVAKWGVSITAHDTGDVFAKEYDAIAGQDNTVIAGGEYKVIAPGTKKDNAALVTLSGKPEVSVQVTYNAEHFSLTGNWIGDENNTFYCPLIIKVTGKVGDAVKTETINCVEKTSAAEVETAVKNAVAACSATYGPNTDLSTVAGDGLKISWEWPFEGTANQGQTDAKDTYLGNQAATATGLDIPAIHVPVTATVTQID
ncbi:hypothetical protein [Ruminococcus sp.]|uniref:hypothetical protein n=1 Tax=Ruminococcus sp. TaxID=41978 RepID=UPI0025D40F6D|nr:hypothetical protein [Ruminococcus sp.]